MNNKPIFFIAFPSRITTIHSLSSYLLFILLPNMDSINEQQCPICLEIIGLINCCTTKCGHCFHTSCLMTGLLKNGNCPLCRTALITIGNADDNADDENADDANSYEEEEEEFIIDNMPIYNVNENNSLKLDRLVEALRNIEQKFRTEGDVLALNTSLTFRNSLYYSTNWNELEQIAWAYYNNPIDPDYPNQTISWEFYYIMDQITDLVKIIHPSDGSMAV